jgi:hypothetical protein
MPMLVAALRAHDAKIDRASTVDDAEKVAQVTNGPLLNFNSQSDIPSSSSGSISLPSNLSQPGIPGFNLNWWMSSPLMVMTLLAFLKIIACSASNDDGPDIDALVGMNLQMTNRSQ